MEKKIAIRKLKRRPDGTMGVVLVDAQTGLEVINPEDYQIKTPEDEQPQGEFGTNLNEDGKKDPKEQKPSDEETKKIFGEGNPPESTRLGSVYDNNEVFDAPDTPISAAIDKGKTTRTPTRDNTISVDTSNKKNNTKTGITAKASLGNTENSTGFTAGYNPDVATGGSLDDAPQGLAGISPSFGKTIGTKGTISDFDRTGLSESAASMADKMSAFGYGDLGVNSSYRNPTTNAKVGGAKKSQHLQGNAIDVNTRGLTDTQREGALDAALSGGAQGVGIYNGGTTMHADTRPGGFAMWGPNGYTGSDVSQMPGWSQDNLQAKIDAGPFSYLSQHNVPTPTARPTQDDMMSASQEDDTVASQMRDTLTPAQKAAMGYTTRTQEEKDAMAMALAGELSQNSLAALAMGDDQAVSEVANMIGALENRAVTRQTDLIGQLTPNQVNSVDPRNATVTIGNYGKYGPQIKAAIDSFYSGQIPNSLSMPNVTHWANMDVVDPSWANYAADQQKIGAHTFFGGLMTRDMMDTEYDLPGFDNPANSVNQTARDSWANKAGSDLSSSSPFGNGGVNPSKGASGSVSVGGSKGSIKGGGSYGVSGTAGAGVGSGTSGRTNADGSVSPSRGASGSVSLGGSKGTNASGKSGAGVSAGAKGSVSLGGKPGGYSSKGGTDSPSEGGGRFGGSGLGSASSDGMGGRTDGWT